MKTEEIRTEMVRTLWVFLNTPSSHSSKRDVAWDEYCKNRESFLKQSAYERGLSYIPLAHTIVIPGPYRN